MDENDVLNAFIEKVTNNIDRYHMLQTGDGVVVAVSGGPDSLALLHVLVSLKKRFDIELAVAHVEHGIRGAESYEDLLYVLHLSQSLSLPIYIKRIDIPYYARQHGLTEEEAGRLARYDFFDAICKCRGYNKIAIAHHKDDQAETVLMHILRGSGLEGLTGMKAVRGRIIRPLLDISKDEIERYCAAVGLRPRRDYTNMDLSYTRNRIRLKLMPYLRKDFNPQIVESLVRMAQLLKDDDDFLRSCTLQALRQCVHFEQNIAVLNVQAFTSYHVSLQRRMARQIMFDIKGNLNGMESIHIDRFIEFVASSYTGMKYGPIKGVMAERSYGEVFIYTLDRMASLSVPFCYPIPVPGKVHVKNGGFDLLSSIIDKNVDDDYNSDILKVYMDMDKIHFPIYVRNRRNGDRFMPIGSKGHKKLKSYFIDCKVPHIYRDSIPLVASDHEVLWIIGDRISDVCRVDGSTKRILKLEYIKIAEGENAGDIGQNID